MSKGTICKVIILGRLGQDPEVRATQSGMQVATLSVATNELGRKDPNTGQRGPDETEWNRCVLFGRSAEIAATYLKKGSMVYLEGRLKTTKWTDQNGQDRYTTEIVCNEMQLMGGDQQQSGQNSQKQAPQRPAQQSSYTPPHQRQAPQDSQPQPAQQGGGYDNFDDDIPF